MHLGDRQEFEFFLAAQPDFGQSGKLLFDTIWGYIRGEHHIRIQVVYIPSAWGTHHGIWFKWQ